MLRGKIIRNIILIINMSSLKGLGGRLCNHDIYNNNLKII